jgi:hypothetical protein
LVIVGIIEAEAFVKTVQDRMLMIGGQNNDNHDRGSSTALNEEQNTADDDCMEERVFALDYGRVRWSHFLKLCFVYSVSMCFVLLFVLLMSLVGLQGGQFPALFMIVLVTWGMRTFVSRVALTNTGIRYDRLNHPFGTAFLSQAALYKSGRSVHTTTLHVRLFSFLFRLSLWPNDPPMTEQCRPRCGFCPALLHSVVLANSQMLFPCCFLADHVFLADRAQIPYSAIQGIECKKRHYAGCSCVFITGKTDGSRLMVEGINEVEEFIHMVENGMRGIDNNMIYNSYNKSDACTFDEDFSEGP